MALESDLPLKSLKLGPLKGGVFERERDAASMSAAGYVQKHWSEFREEYSRFVNNIRVS
jgi:hypothetical protein